MQALHLSEVIQRLRIRTDRMQNARAEFIGAGGGEDDHRAQIARLAAIALCRTIGNRCVRVKCIPRMLVDLTYLLCRLSIVCKSRPEILTERRENHACVIRALLREGSHPRGDLCRILRQMIEQALEIARDEDVHGRRHRLIEGTAAIIDAAAQEIREHIVLV